MEGLIQEYISELNEQEKIVLAIAKEHLESSYDVEKSIGFIRWKSQRELSKKTTQKESD
jgi:hypothetical protein